MAQLWFLLIYALSFKCFQVAKFAATGRLQCKIDSVSGTVVTSAATSDPPPDIELDRSLLYKATVRRGDILLNRLKKLARVMDF